MTAPATYTAYTRLEARSAVRTHHLWASVTLVVMGIACGILPRVPAIQQFFEVVFGARNGVHTILINDYTGLLGVAYWVGVFDLLRVYITPAEERQLALYLSKPISRGRYFLSKLLPTTLTLSVVYLIGMAGSAAGVLILGEPADFKADAFLANSLTIFGLTLLMLAVANLAFLFVRDTYNALLAASGIFVATVLPGGMYIYRPDLYTEPLLRKLLVFPANLLWHEDRAVTVAAVAVPLFLTIAAAITGVAAWWLRRTDSIKA